MSKNPIINAFSASAYILLIGITMNLLSSKLSNTPDTFFAPVVFLLLLTLSVAVMAFLFFYQPLLLLIDNKRKEAVSFFAKTIGVFAIIAIGAIVLLSIRVI